MERIRRSFIALAVLLQLFLLAGTALSQCPDMPDCSGMKYIKVNMHFMLLDDGTGNFTETDDGRGNPPAATYGPAATAYTFAQDLLQEANRQLADNIPMDASEGYTPPPACPVQFRYVLTGVYLHRNSDYYYFHDSGPYYNQESNAWMDTFGVNKEDEINIFSLYKTITNTGGIAAQAGCPAGNCWAKIVTPWADDIPTHTKAANLNHEIAHLLNLYHIFQYDYCDDTPLVAPVSTLNIMDYCKDYTGTVKCLQAITPCQLTRMYQHLSTLNNYTICSDSIPAVALFSLPQVTKPGEPVYLDGSWRRPENRQETGYSIRIYETDTVESAAIVGSIHTFYFTGQYEKIPLSSFFNFEAGKVYRITLSVTGHANKHANTKFVSTSH